MTMVKWRMEGRAPAITAIRWWTKEATSWLEGPRTRPTRTADRKGRTKVTSTLTIVDTPDARIAHAHETSSDFTSDDTNDQFTSDLAEYVDLVASSTPEKRAATNVAMKSKKNKQHAIPPIEDQYVSVERFKPEDHGEYVQLETFRSEDDIELGDM